MAKWLFIDVNWFSKYTHAQTVKYLKHTVYLEIENNICATIPVSCDSNYTCKMWE